MWHDGYECRLAMICRAYKIQGLFHSYKRSCERKGATVESCMYVIVESASTFACRPSARPSERRSNAKSADLTCPTPLASTSISNPGSSFHTSKNVCRKAMVHILPRTVNDGRNNAPAPRLHDPKHENRQHAHRRRAANGL